MNITQQTNPALIGYDAQGRGRALSHRNWLLARISASGWALPKRRWAAAAVILAAICGGNAATYAATPQVRAQTADLILARAEAHLEFANARLQLSTEMLREVEALSTTGRASPFEHVNALIEFSRSQADASARALDVAESRISGLEPSNTLSAPLMGGRDYVTERLRIRRKALAEHATHAGQVTEAEEKLFAVGHETNRESRFREVFEVASATVSSLGGQLKLREDFLAGKLTAQKVELEQMRLEIKARREAAVPRLARVEKKLSTTRILVETGRSTGLEVLQVEIEYREAVLELKLIQLDMQIIERELAALPKE